MENIESTVIKPHKIKVLLIDDQNIIGEAVKRMLASESDIEFHFCMNPTLAIKTAEEIEPTVILQDLVMPDIDGLMLVKFFRANQKTKDIPLIVLSSKEEPKVKAEAFALGANDYLVKLPDKVELIARVRYHSSGYIALMQRNEAYKALVESQKQLADELNEAAEYVISLLPINIKGEITTDSVFIPSTELGGDSFGFHWIDDENFAVYLLDVCGHGVGAALLSITVMNVLRSQSLPAVDFLNPGEVLFALNNMFRMENQNYKFFTIWYGIYNRKSGEIVFSSGGHPPAVLLSGDDYDNLTLNKLSVNNLAIGYVPDVKFKEGRIQTGKVNKLFVYSDGIYEVKLPNGDMTRISDFMNLLMKKNDSGKSDIDFLISEIQNLSGNPHFDDDVSLLQINIKR